MMKCEDAKLFMMGYLDGELQGEDKENLEKHLAQCKKCSAEFEEFKRLHNMTSTLQLSEPEDQLWQQYWAHVYNRIERGVGWIFFSIGAILLLVYGGFKAIESIIVDPTLGIVIKVGLLAVMAGTAILFVSVARERWFFWRKDRYRYVRR